MNDFEALGITDFDHIEFAVADLEKAAELYLRMGFEKAGSREILERKLKSDLYVQNNIRVLLSRSDEPNDPVGRFVEKHGDGVMSVAFRCHDALSAFDLAVRRGATVWSAPRSYKKDFGEVQHGSIKTFGDVQHVFISRKGTLFKEGFEDPLKSQNRGVGLERVDHVTCNVEQGKLDEWTAFYEKIFGLKNTRFFDIHGKKTGLYSKVMQSPDGVIKIPFNEPTESASQIQEFIDVNHGPGVQHIALLTNQIIETVRPLRKDGLKFLSTPHTYYQALASRVKNVSENLGELEELQLLVDGDDNGYLLQVFTQNVVGPFFYEVIQRKGNDGFGEGNFKALFEAMERDQISRGVLK